MDNILRFKYHFEPENGWINDPNGLVYFRGKYHAFFQHYPYAPHWGQMHWGHAVSTDLIHWEELPIALFPDQPYEDDGGCFSGCALVDNDRLYLFYTSVSYEMGQTQSVAFSDDGIHFEKYAGNPIIRSNPLGFPDFRDPKVSLMDGVFRMVVGTGDQSCGKVLLFESDDLLHWRYAGVLFEGSEFPPCIECPDFFQMDEKYVLMFSKIDEPSRATHFVVGDFWDGKLRNYTISLPEWGPDFYAPQTFWDGRRRIMIGWMYHWGKKSSDGISFAGALSIPRELRLRENRVMNYPVAEAEVLLKDVSTYVRVEDNALILTNRADETICVDFDSVESVAILEDTKSVEVFVNGGEYSVSLWLI